MKQLGIIIFILIANISCESSKKVDINSNLESLIVELGNKLECQDVEIQTLGAPNSFHVIYSNSAYASDIKERTEHYQEKSIDMILSGLTDKKDLPDSLVIEFSEGILHNDIGMKRNFEWRYGYSTLSIEFDWRHSIENILVTRGKELLATESYEEIDSICSIYISEQKQLPIIYQIKAMSYLQQEDTNMSIKYFQNALSLDSSNINVHISLGSLFLQTNQYESAMNHSFKIWEIDSSDPRSYYIKAYVLLKENPDEACELFIKSKSLGLDEAGSDLLFNCNS